MLGFVLNVRPLANSVRGPGNSDCPQIISHGGEPGECTETSRRRLTRLVIILEIPVAVNININQ